MRTYPRGHCSNRVLFVIMPGNRGGLMLWVVKVALKDSVSAFLCVESWEEEDTVKVRRRTIFSAKRRFCDFARLSVKLLHYSGRYWTELERTAWLYHLSDTLLTQLINFRNKAGQGRNAPGVLSTYCGQRHALHLMHMPVLAEEQYHKTWLIGTRMIFTVLERRWWQRPSI